MPVEGAVVIVRAHDALDQLNGNILETIRELGLEPVELRQERPAEGAFAHAHAHRRAALARVSEGTRAVLAAYCGEPADRPGSEKCSPAAG